METAKLIFDFLGPDPTEMRQFIHDVWPENPDANVLDLASGNGDHLFGFIDKPVASVTVVDNSEEALRLLLERHSNHKQLISPICADLGTWACDRKYDVVHMGDNSIQMFASYKDQFNIIKTMASCLSDKGFGLLNVTPVTERQIMEYCVEPKRITTVKNGGETVEVFGQIKVDVFNQDLIMYFSISRDGIEEGRSTCRCRMLLKHEIEEMVKAAGLKVVQVRHRKLKRGNDSYYYLLQLNQ
ncbi:class I SAM-dependent methyltransferase [Paenibacillus sp. M1]|uniref:Class I SAM-dependent methyltransferase n=1 Tax=Paenibacillus haidiansis TaxID=1574488 RepID=A0ABU7VS83_9BACL